MDSCQANGGNTVICPSASYNDLPSTNSLFHPATGQAAIVTADSNASMISPLTGVTQQQTIFPIFNTSPGGGMVSHKSYENILSSSGNSSHNASHAQLSPTPSSIDSGVGFTNIGNGHTISGTTYYNNNTTAAADDLPGDPRGILYQEIHLEDFRKKYFPNSLPPRDGELNDGHCFSVLNIRPKVFLFQSKNHYIAHYCNYYFSKENLTKDIHTSEKLRQNGGFLRLFDLAQFPKLVAVGASQEDIELALSTSGRVDVIMLNDTQRAVRRKDLWYPVGNTPIGLSSTGPFIPGKPASAAAVTVTNASLDSTLAASSVHATPTQTFVGNNNILPTVLYNGMHTPTHNFQLNVPPGSTFHQMQTNTPFGAAASAGNFTAAAAASSNGPWSFHQLGHQFAGGSTGPILFRVCDNGSGGIQLPAGPNWMYPNSPPGLVIPTPPNSQVIHGNPQFHHHHLHHPIANHHHLYNSSAAQTQAPPLPLWNSVAIGNVGNSANISSHHDGLIVVGGVGGGGGIHHGISQTAGVGGAPKSPKKQSNSSTASSLIVS